MTIIAPSIPEIGLHTDMPGSIYHGLPLASNHFLSVMHELSPFHAMYQRTSGQEASEAMKIGDAAHAFLLEPERLEREYACSTRCCAQTKGGNPCQNNGHIGRVLPDGSTAWYCGVRGHDIGVGDRETREAIDPDVYAVLRGLRDAVWSDPDAETLLESRTATELSAIWRDPASGVVCKGRLDALCEDVSTVIDIKTTTCCKPVAFEKAIFDYGYFRQAAMYLDALNVLKRPCKHFVIIAVEKKPPHAVQVYRLQNEVIEAGYQAVRPLLMLYAECEKRKQWPSYGSGIQEIGVPDWAWKKLNIQQSGGLAA